MFLANTAHLSRITRQLEGRSCTVPGDNRPEPCKKASDVKGKSEAGRPVETKGNDKVTAERSARFSAGWRVFPGSDGGGPGGYCELSTATCCSGDCPPWKGMGQIWGPAAFVVAFGPQAVTCRQKTPTRPVAKTQPPVLGP